MMKFHRLVAVSLCGLSLLSAPAMAHHLWVEAEATADKVSADMIYGHHFAVPEPIAEKRLSIFEPTRLFTPKGDKVMAREGSDNWHYEVAEKLGDGVYAVTATYKPTTWSNGPDGWAMKDRTEYPTATYSERASMNAKTLLFVGNGGDDSLLSKPVGQKLEIVLMADPRKAELDKPLPIKVLYEGKGLKTAEVKARFTGFSDDDSDEAFYGRTNLKGEGHIIPLKPGFWAIEVEHKEKTTKGEAFDEYVTVATLTFEIPSK